MAGAFSFSAPLCGPSPLCGPARLQGASWLCLNDRAPGWARLKHFSHCPLLKNSISCVLASFLAPEFHLTHVRNPVSCRFCAAGQRWARAGACCKAVPAHAAPEQPRQMSGPTSSQAACHDLWPGCSPPRARSSQGHGRPARSSQGPCRPGQVRPGAGPGSIIPGQD